MRSGLIRATAAIALLLVALQGCGIVDPLNEPTRGGRQTSVRELTAESPNEVATPPVDLREIRTSRAPASTAAEAVVRFACGYTNWTYATLANVRRSLATISVGAAANEQRRAAAEIPRDYQLRRGRVENSGQVVFPAAGGTTPPACEAPQRSDPGFRRFVVVTLERTTAAAGGTYAGARPAYHVTLATAAHLRGGGWAVSSWRPQN